MADNTIEMRNPFTGISPYSDNSEYILRGRDSETWQLYNRILRNSYTVYYAESGEGKSSLIKAGLFPLIRMKNFFPIYITLTDEDFKSEKFSLYNRINESVEDWNEHHEGEAVECFVGETSKPNDVARVFAQSEWLGLRCCYFKKRNRFTKEWERDLVTKEEKLLTPIFVFDQFEEVFTKSEFKWIDSFMLWLGQIMSDVLPGDLEGDVFLTDLRVNLSEHFRILFSMRTEYLGELDYWCSQRYILPQLQDNRLCLKPLTIKGAKEVIGLCEDLRKYESAIIKGCIPERENPESDEAPCVYALILSVVCHYLYDKDKERETLLKELGNNASKVVDAILYSFYTDSLRSVGIRNESLMEKFDEAFVDSRGKRRRQTMGEGNDVDLFEEWIFIPAGDDEKSKGRSLISLGLIKTQGRNQGQDQKEHLVVELPHDRLCKAVNTFRNERKRNLEEKNKRLKEWIQFGLISAILGFVSICIWWLISSKDSFLKSLTNSFYNSRISVNDLFEKYLHNQPALLESKESLDESFSTCLLLAFYAVIFPFVVNFWSKNGIIGKICGILTSFVGAIAFILLAIRSWHIAFTYKVQFVMMLVGAAVCCIIFIIKSIHLRAHWKKRKYEEVKECSSWPLFGGYFLFGCVLMGFFTFNETFGQPTPNDAYWALILLPLLSSACTWGFLKLNYKNNRRKVIKYIGSIIVVVLVVLSSLLIIPKIIGFIPVPFSSSCIVAFLMLTAIALWMFMCDSTRKCIKGTIINGTIVLLVNGFNLGYNPFCVNPSFVFCVHSWKTVIVKDIVKPVTQADSLKMKLGVVYWDGEDILPCQIEVDKEMLQNIARRSGLFSNSMAKIRSRIPVDSIPNMKRSAHNTDNSFFYDDDGYIYGSSQE